MTTFAKLIKSLKMVLLKVNTLKLVFQDFLYHHLYTQSYEEIRQRSNQPVRFFATAKAHTFQFIEDISLGSLKLRTIIDETGIYIYNASKVVAKYLSP